MAGKIEKELSAATGVMPKAKEKRQDFLKRLLGGVSDLDDGPFKELSPAAQKWNNTAAKLFDKDEELPEPDGDAAEAEKPAKGKAKPAPAEDEDADSDNAGDDDETNADDDADAADEGETEDTTVKTSKKPAAKKAEAKKTPAKADKAPAKKASAAGTKGDGYKGHRTGSRKEQVHKVYDDKGKDAAIKKAEALDIQTNTARGWISSWGPSAADKGKDTASKAKAKK